MPQAGYYSFHFEIYNKTKIIGLVCLTTKSVSSSIFLEEIALKNSEKKKGLGGGRRKTETKKATDDDDENWNGLD